MRQNPLKKIVELQKQGKAWESTLCAVQIVM